MNTDTIVLCRDALQLNQICFIIDELHNITTVPELIRADSIVFCWAAL